MPHAESRLAASLNPKRQVFVFSGGGTGGHLTPGLALAAALQEENTDSQIQFVGSEKPLEKEMVLRHGFSHTALPVEPLPTLKRAAWRFLWHNWRSYRMAAAWVEQHKPDCVIGLGGFASAPLVLAASRRSVPVLLLEQNVIPGRATRWLAKRAQGIVVSFHETGRQLKTRIHELGVPVRATIADLATSDSAAGHAPADPQLLILGGSQGARSLNEAVLQAFAELKSDLSTWRIVHQTGADQADWVRSQYAILGLAAEVSPFIDDMAASYRKTSLVISRAGATTLAELACAGLPAILVPFPFAADDHQRANALAYVQSGAARMVLQDDLVKTGAILKTELGPLLRDAELRRSIGLEMRKLARPRATAGILALIREYTVGHKSP